MMIANLFRFKRKAQSISAAIPDGHRVYAIGDIHGRFDLFKELLGKIYDDCRARGDQKTIIIFLGDLIDRGPESFEVMQALMTLKAGSDNVYVLSGNHEEVFLRAAKGDSRATRFLDKIGGRETVLSYGVSEAQYDTLDYEELTALLMERVPQTHIDFIESFEDAIEIGDYVFVHAGVRPEVELDDQKPSDLRWIRDEFLHYPRSFGHVIVHGHTITDDIDYRHNRIGIDTGAFASGKLTALGLEGTDRWSLQTQGDPKI